MKLHSILLSIGLLGSATKAFDVFDLQPSVDAFGNLNFFDAFDRGFGLPTHFYRRTPHHYEFHEDADAHYIFVEAPHAEHKNFHFEINHELSELMISEHAPHGFEKKFWIPTSVDSSSITAEWVQRDLLKVVLPKQNEPVIEPQQLLERDLQQQLSQQHQTERREQILQQRQAERRQQLLQQRREEYRQQLLQQRQAERQEQLLQQRQAERQQQLLQQHCQGEHQQQPQRAEQVENLHEQEPAMYKDQDPHTPVPEVEEFGTEPVKFTKFRKVVGGYVDPRGIFRAYYEHQQQPQRAEQVENLRGQEPHMYKNQDSHMLVPEVEEFGTEPVNFTKFRKVVGGYVDPRGIFRAYYEHQQQPQRVEQVEHLHEQEPAMYKDQDPHISVPEVEEFGTELVNFTKLKKVVGGYVDPRGIFRAY